MSNKYNFLVETSDQVETLTENTDNGKQYFIEGIFAQAEVVNGNKRKYPKNVMVEAADAYINNYVNKRRALGELNHPEYPTADPDKAAIRIVEMKWINEKDIYGKALVLNTPKGQTVRGLLEGDFNMGVSTRGLGSLKEQANGTKLVEKFMMTAVDCVDNPSGPDCYVNPLLESQQWMVSESTGMWIPIMNENENEKFNQELFLEKLDNFVKQFKNKR